MMASPGRNGAGPMLPRQPAGRAGNPVYRSLTGVRGGTQARQPLQSALTAFDIIGAAKGPSRPRRTAAIRAVGRLKSRQRARETMTGYCNHIVKEHLS
jgi:hypothetical protein